MLRALGFDGVVFIAQTITVERMTGLMSAVWSWLKRPSRLAWSLIAVIAFIGGVAFWGAFHTAMKVTDNIEFCVSCHSMEKVYEEYKKTVHYQNNSGVRAICTDCHVPKEWGPYVLAKIEATGDLYGEIMGVIDTPEKFEERRLVLAQRVWRRMEETDSRECRNCHAFDAMAVDAQKEEAKSQHPKAIKDGETCISCHKGIAHEMPDMSAGYRQVYKNLLAAGEDVSSSATQLFSVKTKNLFLKADDKKASARLLGAASLNVLDSDGDRIQVKISGWQQEGVDKIIYALPGKRIFVAALGKSAIPLLKKGKTQYIEAADQTWQEASVVLWTDKKGLVDDLNMIWDYTSQVYTATCAVCHRAHDPHEFLANQWMGQLKAMKRFASMNKEQYRLVQTYLQMHASDTGGKGKH